MYEFLQCQPWPPRRQHYHPRGIPPSHFYVGLDLGQRQDHSAVAVVEHRYEPHGPFDWALRVQPLTGRLYVRQLLRFRRDVPYPAVVDSLRRLVARPALSGLCTLVVDATGVGGPVVDLLRDGSMNCQLHAIQITGGQQSSHSRGMHRVPKRDLVGTLVLLLEQEMLRISPSLPGLDALRREFQTFRVRTNSAGAEQYGATGAKDHDDLLLALALACDPPYRTDESLRPGRSRNTQVFAPALGAPPAHTSIGGRGRSII